VKKETNIDQLFRDGLQEPDLPFNEEDWQKMSQKLDRKKETKVPVWLLWASATAAVILIGLFWMFLPSAPIRKAVQVTKVIKQKPLVIPPAAKKDGQAQTVKVVRSAKEKLVQAVVVTKTDLLTESLRPILVSSAQLSPTQIDLHLNGMVNNSSAPKTPQLAFSSVEKSIKRNMLSGGERSKGLVLSAMLAPDLSYAQSSIDSRVSTNVGLLASYGISNKLSVTTGAIYSNKFYNSKGSGLDGYGSTGTTFQINAACNVLDIPLNVNYKLLDKKAYSVTINTGLSSYLMLKEKYDYIYPEVGAAPNVVSVEVKNQNQHLLGVANLSFMVERKISPHLSIGVQPFMKVPLTGIGLGEANLKSSGMSFSINMSLFRERKPGKLAGLKRFNPLSL
jgi:hypothetical protein